MTSLFSYFRHRYDKLKGDVAHSHPKESEIRQRLKKELYEYNQSLFHGFPSKPSAFAYDPKLKLLALATQSGCLRVYGTPGVEFSASHESGETVTKLVFLPDEGRLVSLTSDNILHLWEIKSDDFTSSMEERITFKEFASDGSKSKAISVIELLNDKLLVGTDGGNVHILELPSLKLTEQVIYQDTVVRSVPDDYRVNPGAVESMKPHPTDTDKFLIGYNRGLIVLWDLKKNAVEQNFNANQQLESLCWHRTGKEFISSHIDGSYAIWSADDGTEPKEDPFTPYGPFPCKSITKIDWKLADGEAEPFVIFSGGMARGSYGDKYTVSVIQGEKHVTLDFTSRVLDFLVLTHADEEQHSNDASNSTDRPHSLLVLLEEEIVAIDLQTNGWPPYRLPYLNSIHASAITASAHISNVPESLWKKIVDAGNHQFAAYSKKEWPVNGGERQEMRKSRDLLLTGHEDGSIKFWDASSVSMELLYKLSTAGYFEEGFNEQDLVNGIRDPMADEEDEWPPFRKSGVFDPYTDDPRLGIQKVFLCPVSDILVAAGTSGQVIVLQMERELREIDIKVCKINLTEDRENFVWKSHPPLTVVSGDAKYNQGFQPQCILQMVPPAACTALAVHTEWQLLSSGTAHGFCLFDFCQRRAISATCTLNASETSASDESSMSRRKSFKKSLRESFRRLRRRRSMSKPKKDTNSGAASNRLQEINADDSQGHTPRPHLGRKLPPPSSIEEDMPHAERAIEERSATADASQAGMVRCLHFADTYLMPTIHSPSLFAGTSSGKIYIFSITLPAYDKRDQEDVLARMSKEVTLRHQAPVIGLTVVDGNYYPLPPALEVQNGRAKAPDMNGNHRLLVISEEQFKLFGMPTFKPEDKWKLTAHEGARTRKVATCTFRSRSDEQYNEMDIACITNMGQLSVYTIKGLRRQMNIDAINKTDINGISSCLFASTGEGFFLRSSSEYSRFTLSAARVIRPLCKLNLKDGLRTPEGTPQIVVEHYDETHSAETRDSVTSPGDVSVDQSFQSADITQDEVRDYVHEDTPSAQSPPEQISSTNQSNEMEDHNSHEPRQPSEQSESSQPVPTQTVSIELRLAESNS